MNMYLHELKAYRKSTIIWTLSLVAVAVFFLSLFPSFAKDAEQFKKLLEGYPEAVRKAIGLNIDNIASILGFYSYAFLYITLCGAIQAMNLGVSIFSKEVREKTADFLLTKPVTRTSIMTSKLLAALTSLVMTNAVYLAAASIMASQVKTEDYSSKIFFMISITLFFIQLIFLALGMIMSVIVRKIKSVLAVSLSTVFTLFIIGMLSSTAEDETLRYLSPFKYFDNDYIIKNSAYETSFLIVGIGLIVVSIAASYFIYAKKDIHAV
ncbi:ABC transporter permease [Bacillus methanolicus]|uniref:ABC transporter permease subunit n=1 Tax=Bacillus methanolicus TaxID=1471 RepID=UPI00200EEB93|nr:ABC transporter permease subunit [Bacillus methanolicus]UQD53674.1 ABC transporter permease [Bacillus methanolicus]